MLIMYLKHIFGITLIDIAQINQKKKRYLSHLIINLLILSI